jgi:hypothetical protein
MTKRVRNLVCDVNLALAGAKKDWTGYEDEIELQWTHATKRHQIQNLQKPNPWRHFLGQDQIRKNYRKPLLDLQGWLSRWFSLLIFTAIFTGGFHCWFSHCWFSLLTVDFHCWFSLLIFTVDFHRWFSHCWFSHCWFSHCWFPLVTSLLIFTLEASRSKRSHTSVKTWFEKKKHNSTVEDV